MIFLKKQSECFLTPTAAYTTTSFYNSFVKKKSGSYYTFQLTMHFQEELTQLAVTTVDVLSVFNFEVQN